MADAITIKALQDASLDAKSLEEVVNGDDTKQVTTRLGETYPSVKKAVKTMFENGGLPAVPFATKALMTASALADGSYAMVTDDSVLANNGLYHKVSGVWSKSKYDIESITEGTVEEHRESSNDWTTSTLNLTDKQLKNLPYDSYDAYSRIINEPFADNGTIEQINFMLGGFAVGRSVTIDINILNVTDSGFVSTDTYRITDSLTASANPTHKEYLIEPVWLALNSVNVKIPFKKGQVLAFSIVTNQTVRKYQGSEYAGITPNTLVSSYADRVIRSGQALPSSIFTDDNSIMAINFKVALGVTDDWKVALKNQVRGVPLDLPFMNFAPATATPFYRIFNDPARQSGVIREIHFMSGAGTAVEEGERTDVDYLIAFRIGVYKKLDDNRVVLDRYYDIRNDSKDSFVSLRNIPKNTFQKVEVDIPIVKGEFIGIRPDSQSMIRFLSTTYYESGNGYTYSGQPSAKLGKVVSLTIPDTPQAAMGVSVVIDYLDARASKSAEIAHRVNNRDSYLLQTPFSLETRSKKWDMGHYSQDATIVNDYILSGLDNFCYLHKLSDKSIARKISQDIGHMGNLDYSPLHDYLSSVPLQHESYYIAEGRQQVKFIKNFSSHLDDASYNVADMEIVPVYFDKGVGLEGVFTLEETSMFRHLYPHFVFDNAQKGLGYLFLTGSWYQKLVVAKVSLGMGDNDLSVLDNGFGTFTAGVGGDDFNGTSMLLGKWNSMSTGSYQGGCIFGGNFYVSWSRPAASAGVKTEPTAYRKNELIRFAFGEDGTMRIDKKYTSHELDADGRESSIEAESAFCDGTYIYNTSVFGSLYAYPLDYSTPMRGSAVIGADGTVTVDYDFACTSTPHVQVTPTNASGAGMYVSAKSAEGFTVTGVNGATFDWSAPITQ